MDERRIELIGAAGGVGTTTLAVALAKLLGGRATAGGMWGDDARQDLADAAGVPAGEPVKFGDGPMVVDRGSLPGPNVGGTAETYLVMRGPDHRCFKHALACEGLSNVSGIIVVTEPGRALDVRDVSVVLNFDPDLIIEVPYDPAVARAVDAGLLHERLPASLESALAAHFSVGVPA